MDSDIKLDLDSPMYGRAEMLQKYLFEGTTSQIANWMDRDEFPCAPRDDGPSKHYRFTPREAIEATIVGQLLNTVCTDTKTGVKVAARAVTGRKSPREVELYTQAAAQFAVADPAIAAVASTKTEQNWLTVRPS